MSLYPLDKIIKRVSKARSNKQRWDSILRDCYDYASPERQTIDDFSAGQQKRVRAYDSTAIEGLEQYASRLQQEIVPPWKTWANLIAGSEIPEESHLEANQYLEKQNDIIFDHIHHSNFSTQIHESFLDLGISTGAIIIEENVNDPKSSLKFRSVSLSDIMIERTSMGNIGSVWRELKIPASDIMRVFPRATLNAEIERIIKEDGTKEITLIEGCFYHEEKKGYITTVYHEASLHVLVESISKTSAWVVFRESVTSGESYGRGRVLRMLPDISTLNKMVEHTLTVSAVKSGGIWTAVDDGIINPYTLNIEPNTIIPVGSNSTENPSLRPLEAGGDFMFHETYVKELQDKVRKALLGDPFGEVNETPVRSATEMSMRNDEFNKTYASAYGRLQTELLEQMLTRIVDILVTVGKIEPIEIDGKSITIKFTSPMAKQQARENITNVLQTIEMMAALPQEAVMRTIKVEDVPKFISEEMNIPSSLMRTDTEAKAFDKVAQEGAKQMQQQAQQGGQNVQQGQ